jgi:GNAT superfamily N-acetyltransferase
MNADALRLARQQASAVTAVAPLYFPRDRAALKAHFAALGGDCLRHRFGTTVKRSGVTKFLDQLRLRGIPSYGIFDSSRALVAVCQLAASGSDLEAGLTVLPAVRCQGFGTTLLRRAASYARARGLKALIVHCQADNSRMLSLARRMGMSVHIETGDADGRLTLRTGSILDLWVDIAYDQAGIADLAVKGWRDAGPVMAPSNP